MTVITHENKAKKIVDAIINDMNQRKGLGNMWDEIDEDIQQEIRYRWISLAMSELVK